jgi:nucleoside-diphosphate-sugar epimerase
VEDGNNRWPAIHRLDAAHLYRLAVEKGIKGARYNGVAEEGIKIREIAELTGKTLNLPVKSNTGEEAARHFEWMIRFIGFDEPATSLKRRNCLAGSQSILVYWKTWKKTIFNQWTGIKH